MRDTSRLSTRSRFHRLAPQVQRPRLRPGWRVALKALVAAAAVTVLYLAEHAAIGALVGREFAIAADRTISPKEERALNALLARIDAERAADEERARRIAATHIDPQSCEFDFHVDVPFCDETMYQSLKEQRMEGSARARGSAAPRRTGCRRGRAADPVSRRPIACGADPCRCPRMVAVTLGVRVALGCQQP